MNKFGNNLFAFLGLAWAAFGVWDVALSDESVRALSFLLHAPTFIIPGVFVFAYFISRKPETGEQ